MAGAMRLLAPLVALTLLAGCFGAEVVPTERSATAMDGKASPGWAYDGAGVTGAGATLSATLDNAANTGVVHVEFDYHGARYVVHFAEFKQAEGKAFMDGGVAFDLVEHGDSGTADASIPKITARIAAWGVATVTRDGEALVGAAGPLWSAHLMVSDDTVRSADGKITKADGAAPYAPDAAGDAKVVAGDAQALFWIKHPDGETAARAPVVGSGTISCSAGECGTLDVPTENGTESLVVRANFTGPAGSPLAFAQARVSLLDAEGNEVVGQDVVSTPAEPAQVVFELGGEEIPGPLTLRVAGPGAYAVEASYEIAYDDHPFIVLTWDDVVVA